MAHALNTLDELLEDDEKKLTDITPFAGLDLRGARCFGFHSPVQDGWTYIAQQADDTGWNMIDKTALEKSLTKDVDQSYNFIASYRLVDVDDDMSYDVWFDNNKQLWGLQITNSPDAEITVEQRANFFKSDLFKKIAKQTYHKVLDANEIYKKIVQPHLENGELLLVDTVKLDAILHFIDLEHFMQNMLNCKYLGY